MLRIWPDYLKLATWPSSILLIGDPMNINYGLQAFSVMLNIVLFSLVSLLVERGMNKAKVYFILVALLIGVVYYIPVNLYS